MRLLFFAALFASCTSFICAVLAEMMTERIAIMGAHAGLVLTHNPGIAYGIQLPSPLQELLIGIALVLILFIAMREAVLPLTQIGFGFVIGGAVANIIDRAFDGLVTDYIQIETFYIFNVADSFITIGAALLFFSALRRKRA